VGAGEAIPAPLWIIATGIVTTFYWSLVHEIIHGHPTSIKPLNEALLFFSIGWAYPVGRFRDTHLQHHNTGDLTDPFDDPESWYLAGPDWQRSTGISRAILLFNNTLFGRMLIGPIIVFSRFVISEVAAIARMDAHSFGIAKSWTLHLVGIFILATLVANYSAIPIWQLVAAAYLGISFLLIRTFLEHQASPDHGERTVVIEKLCPIAFLFLYNNLHWLHHDRPGLAWYQLPAAYREDREQIIRSNRGYVYNSYLEIIRKYFFHAKEPVKHPFLRQG